MSKFTVTNQTNQFDPSLKNSPTIRIQASISIILSGVLGTLQRIIPEVVEPLSRVLENKGLDNITKDGAYAIEKTAALTAASINNLTKDQLEFALQSLQAVSSQNVWEVVSDTVGELASRYPGNKNLDILIYLFNSLSINLAQGMPLYDFDRILGKMNQLIDQLQIDIKIPGLSSVLPLKLIDLIRLNLESIVEISESLEQLGNQAFDILQDENYYEKFQQYLDFSRSSLYKRYEASQDTLHLGYDINNLNETIERRGDSILIRVMICILVLNVLLTNKENLASIYTFEEIGKLERATTIAAQLVGIWNDFGSSLMRLSEEELKTKMQELRGEGLEESDIIEALVRLGKNPDETKQELKNLFRNPIKDSRLGEPNIGLVNLYDSVDQEALWARRVALFVEVSRISQNLELELGALLQSFPKDIRNIIYSIVVFHSQLYGVNGGDYYDSISPTKLPVLNNTKDPNDFKLEPRESLEF